jgi:fructose-1,6-bisphosphatase
MPLSARSQHSTLTQFLIEERRKYPGASGDFNALILDIALACKAHSANSDRCLATTKTAMAHQSMCRVRRRKL